MRLLIANIAGIPQGSAAAGFVRDVVVPLTRRNAGIALTSADELVFRFAEQGAVHPAFADYPFMSTANPVAMRQMARQAPEEGFDAVVLGCFGDPLLWESRAELPIPVVGFGESSILAAAGIGRRIGVVSSSDLLNDSIADQIASYGLADRLVAVRSIGETGPEQERAMEDSHELIARFGEVARTLIADGADVLVPACGLMSPALRLAPGAEAEFPGGVREVDGVPIVDVVAASIGAAASQVRLATAARGFRDTRTVSDPFVRAADITWDAA